MSKPNEILKAKEIRAIQLYLESDLTAQQIAEECGYANRSSLYKILEKDAAKEMMKKIAEESVQNAVNILKSNTSQVAKRLIEIAKGTDKDIDKQTIYATLSAINSILEKSGLSSKNITLNDLRQKDTSISNEDILSAIDEIKEEDEE